MPRALRFRAPARMWRYEDPISTWRARLPGAAGRHLLENPRVGSGAGHADGRRARLRVWNTHRAGERPGIRHGDVLIGLAARDRDGGGIRVGARRAVRRRRPRHLLLLPRGPPRRDFAARAPRLGQADRDGLLAAGHLLSRAAAAE